MAAQYGPHRWSAGYHDDGCNDALRGAQFMIADLSGARFLDCDMSQVTIVDSWLVGLSVSGYVSHPVVNDVDVTAYVDAGLDRRHPERVQLREIRTAADFRARWETIERLCLGAVMEEESDPHRFATRDLAVLEADEPAECEDSLL